MKSFAVFSFLAVASYVSAQANGGPPFDPAGAKNVGNGAGGQFIGGQCLSAADCASGCCAGPSGICSGVGAQTQAGKTGCGFGGGSAPAAAPPAAAPPANNAGSAASTTPANGGPPFDPAGAKNVGNGAGGQFIGGQCLSSADCGSECCAGPFGICSGVGAQTQAGKTGCGFGDGAAAAPPAAAPPAAAPPAAAPPANNAGSAASTTPANGGPPFDPAGAKNVGNGAGGQFIGGQCLSSADCGSGCCAGPSGICSGVGAQTQAGKTGCGFGDGAAAAPAPAAAAPPANNAGSAASAAPANGGPPFDPAGAKNVGNGAGAQFIGGQCLSAADCGSGCCAGPSGICSGVGAQTQAGKTGCGFVSKRFVRSSRRQLVELLQ